MILRVLAAMLVAAVLAFIPVSLQPVITFDTTQIKIILFGFLWMMALALGWRYNASRLLSIAMAIVIIANLTLTVVSHQLYHGDFTISAADSILNTTPAEAIEMVAQHGGYLLAALAGLIGMLGGIATISHWMPTRGLMGLAMLALLLPAGQHLSYVHKYRDDHFPTVSETLRRTPIYNAAEFVNVLHDQDTVVPVNVTIDYRFHFSKTPIETFVIVLGESARRRQWSLYGYPRETTPWADSQRNELLIFDNAFAGAPVTIHAVPLALSRRQNGHGVTPSFDTIVQAAEQAGFKTFWFSRQDKFGPYDNAVTRIALRAMQHQWSSFGNDESLLPLLGKALQQPGKKLIVLHLTGSHENTCKRYPAAAAWFGNNQPSSINCYDNSIRYTDQLLGEVAAQLSTHQASLLYFSDHGQEWETKPRDRFFHGLVNPTREAYEIPMVLWFSPKVPKAWRHSGHVERLWPGYWNYYLMRDWMGIPDPADPCLSPFRRCHIPAPTVFPVLDGSLKALEFTRLPSSLRADQQPS